jgi:predicted MFS family arabinose efflux permease
MTEHRAAKRTAAAYAAFISLGFPDAVIGVAWPSIREGFELHQSSLGWAFLGTGAGYFCSSFFTGKVMRRLPLGVVLAGSTGLVALSGFGYGLAPFWFFFV